MVVGKKDVIRKRDDRVLNTGARGSMLGAPNRGQKELFVQCYTMETNDVCLECPPPPLTVRHLTLTAVRDQYPTREHCASLSRSSIRMLELTSVD